MKCDVVYEEVLLMFIAPGEHQQANGSSCASSSIFKEEGYHFDRKLR